MDSMSLLDTNFTTNGHVNKIFFNMEWSKKGNCFYYHLSRCSQNSIKFVII